VCDLSAPVVASAEHTTVVDVAAPVDGLVFVINGGATVIDIDAISAEVFVYESQWAESPLGRLGTPSNPSPTLSAQRNKSTSSGNSQKRTPVVESLYR
jgi:hypothetical protein